jgi:hypothetical protein
MFFRSASILSHKRRGSAVNMSKFYVQFIWNPKISQHVTKINFTRRSATEALPLNKQAPEVSQAFFRNKVRNNAVKTDKF